MTDLTYLHAIRSGLARRRSSLPATARPFASNLIEQISAIENQADLDRLRPYMAYEARRLAEASR